MATPVLTPYARWLIKKTTPRPVIPAFTANQLNTISRYMKNHGIMTMDVQKLLEIRERMMKK